MLPDTIFEKAADLIRQALQCGPVPIVRETSAMDVRGWDSLSHTMILLQLEDGFHVRFPMDRVHSARTVGELVDLIVELKAAA